MFRYAAVAACAIVFGIVISLPRAADVILEPLSTGLAVANPSSFPAQASVELLNWDATGPARVGIINLPPFGHRSLFLPEIPGLNSMPIPFQGTVRVTSSTPITASAFRCRINQRGDFLITAGVPFDESSVFLDSELFFPHLAIGGGYDMQFLFLNSRPAGTSTATMHFFFPDGKPLPLPVP